jgi:flavin reductase (DIM6/NTAB) family NADH-FMN oxidoreductase RutF
MSDQRSMVTGVLPCAAVVLTVAAGERRDAMTATAIFVSEDPPLLSVSVAEHVLTHDLIEQAGEFVVNVAAPEQVGMLPKLGSTHGRDIDKFEHFSVSTEPSQEVTGTYASLECKVVASHKAGPYRVYTAEVLAHSVDKRRGPLVWHEGRYYSLGEPVG